MICPFELQKHGVEVRGVVHIGANDGDEIPYYLDMGIENIVCFDPLPKAGADLLEKHGADPRIVFVPLAFGSYDGFQMLTVTSEHGQQSTFLPVENAEIAYGPHRPEYQLTVPVARFDTFMVRAPQQVYERILACNCLVIDVQGMEKQVLDGIGDFLNGFDCAGIECSGVPVYKGEAPEANVINFMARAGFDALNSAGSHGDVLFRRRN